MPDSEEKKSGAPDRSIDSSESDSDNPVEHLAHKLSNALVPLVGYAELLDFEEDDHRQIKQYIREIQRSAALARDLVQELAHLGEDRRKKTKAPSQGSHCMDNPTSKLYCTDKPGKFLLVEDDKQVSLVLREFLGDCGFDVHTFSRAQAVMDFLKTESSDVSAILTDDRMPGITGRNLLKEVQTKFPKIKRFLMSGYRESYNDDPDLYLCFFQKPMELSLLATTLENLLD